MICPICSKHKLLKAEGKWFCPCCYQVYHDLPLYGSLHHLNRSIFLDTCNYQV